MCVGFLFGKRSFSLLIINLSVYRRHCFVADGAAEAEHRDGFDHPAEHIEELGELRFVGGEDGLLQQQGDRLDRADRLCGILGRLREEHDRLDRRRGVGADAVLAVPRRAVDDESAVLFAH